ncbi:hypothetical protein ACET3Z_018215 [Daucus carota]
MASITEVELSKISFKNLQKACIIVIVGFPWPAPINDEDHGQQNHIIRLRVKYNNVILSSSLNQRRSEIIKMGKKIYIDMASKKLINFAIQSAQASQEEDIAATT